MTVERVRAVVLAVAVAIAISTAWSRHAVRTPLPSLHLPTPHTTTVIESVAPALPFRTEVPAEPRLDVNGNEVDDAVGDYRIDRGGEMFERHAPDTALLHLSAPEL